MPGTLAYAIKEDEKAKQRRHNQLVAMAMIPWEARKRCFMELAKEKVITNPTSITLGEAFAIVEAEYVSAITAHRFQRESTGSSPLTNVRAGLYLKVNR